MKKLRIEIADLIEAFDNECEDIYYYLDLLSGEIVKVSEDYCPDETASQIDYNDVKKFSRIIPLSSEEQLQIREDFLQYVDNEHIRDKLEIALSHRGPLRKFAEIVKNYEEVNGKWKEFQEQNMRRHLPKWIDSLDVSAELV